MRNKYMLIGVVGIVVGVLLSSAVFVLAGNPDSPSAPGATDSFTLEDIYNRLDSGAPGAQSAFTEPSVAPGTGTMHTLNEIMAKAPVKDDAKGATTADVLTNKTYWSRRTADWGHQTGTMPDNGAVTIVPTTTNQVIAMGYHDGSGEVVGDTDLISGNIKCGVTIFGVTGTIPPGCVAQTGQTTSYATGDDGAYQKGCPPVVAPSVGYSFGGYNRTSFTCSGGFTGFGDNGDGTVTDNLTGLIWLKDANCWGLQAWADALTNANGLASGSCGLTDGSSAGDWRLPNINELRSLFDPGLSAPYLPAGHPFTGVQSDHYWSSTTCAGYPSAAWGVGLGNSYVRRNAKTDGYPVWPVRGGQ